MILIGTTGIYCMNQQHNILSTVYYAVDSYMHVAPIKQVAGMLSAAEMAHNTTGLTFPESVANQHVSYLKPCIQETAKEVRTQSTKRCFELSIPRVQCETIPRESVKAFGHDLPPNLTALTSL